jgi:hypothetical protein
MNCTQGFLIWQQFVPPYVEQQETLANKSFCFKKGLNKNNPEDTGMHYSMKQTTKVWAFPEKSWKFFFPISPNLCS